LTPIAAISSFVGTLTPDGCALLQRHTRVPRLTLSDYGTHCGRGCSLHTAHSTGTAGARSLRYTRVWRLLDISEIVRRSSSPNLSLFSRVRSYAPDSVVTLWRSPGGYPYKRSIGDAGAGRHWWALAGAFRRSLSTALSHLSGLRSLPTALSRLPASAPCPRHTHISRLSSNGTLGVCG
jgi:hypothetical protein